MYIFNSFLLFSLVFIRFYILIYLYPFFGYYFMIFLPLFIFHLYSMG